MDDKIIFFETIWVKESTLSSFCTFDDRTVEELPSFRSVVIRLSTRGVYYCKRGPEGFYPFVSIRLQSWLERNSHLAFRNFYLLPT